MSRIEELKPPEGSRKRKKRLGRGYGSGRGGSAGRGMKGQKAHDKVRLGFEGGQTPLYMRSPKRGFNNKNRKNYAEVNIRSLNAFAENTVVTPKLLLQRGLITKNNDGVKILGNGKLEKALTVVAHRFSRAAKEKIEAAGGKAEVI